MTSSKGLTQSSSQVAKLIDHTLLFPQARPHDIVKLCEQAHQHNFYSVCLNPCHVTLAKELLILTDVKICTVVGFPLGANETQVKAFEAQCARDQGADEIDMVLNIGALKEGNLTLVQSDIAAVVEAAKGGLVKVILETCLLSPDEIIMACKLSKEVGAHFVKTSTGMSSRGALVEDIKLMRETVGPQLGVKASGGIRSLEALLAMVNAGASRIGTSSGVSILNELDETSVAL